MNWKIQVRRKIYNAPWNLYIHSLNYEPQDKLIYFHKSHHGSLFTSHPCQSIQIINMLTRPLYNSIQSMYWTEINPLMIQCNSFNNKFRGAFCFYATHKQTVLVIYFMTFLGWTSVKDHIDARCTLLGCKPYDNYLTIFYLKNYFLLHNKLWERVKSTEEIPNNTAYTYLSTDVNYYLTTLSISSSISSISNS